MNIKKGDPLVYNGVAFKVVAVATSAPGQITIRAEEATYKLKPEPPELGEHGTELTKGEK